MADRPSRAAAARALVAMLAPPRVVAVVHEAPAASVAASAGAGSRVLKRGREPVPDDILIASGAATSDEEEEEEEESDPNEDSEDEEDDDKDDEDEDEDERRTVARWKGKRARGKPGRSGKRKAEKNGRPPTREGWSGSHGSLLLSFSCVLDLLSPNTPFFEED